MILGKPLGDKKTNEAIILCGGLCTRFRPQTDEIHKCLIEVDGKPILQHQIEWLRKYDVDHIILAAGYKSKAIKEWLNNWLPEATNLGTFHIEINEEETPLGTSGAVKVASKLLIGNKFILVNGDNLSDVNIDSLRSHEANTVVVKKEKFRYGIMTMNSVGKLKFGEKPDFWVNTGIYWLNKKLLPLLDTGSLELEVLPNTELNVYFHPGYWYTFDSARDIEDYENSK